MGGGGEVRHHHGNQQFLRNACDLCGGQTRTGLKDCPLTSDPSSWPPEPWLLVYLADQVCEQLADVLSPLGDVGVESVQVPAEAERNQLEVIWAESEEKQA